MLKIFFTAIAILFLILAGYLKSPYLILNAIILYSITTQLNNAKNKTNNPRPITPNLD